MIDYGGLRLLNTPTSANTMISLARVVCLCLAFVVAFLSIFTTLVNYSLARYLRYGLILCTVAYLILDGVLMLLPSASLVEVVKMKYAIVPGN